MRAISIFIFDDGKSTRGWRARTALRIRVSMSAIGSVVIYCPYVFSLPAGLRHARDFALERKPAEADAAHFEFPQKRARPAADAATVPDANLVLQLLLHLGASCGGRHRLSFCPLVSLCRDYGRSGTPSNFSNSRPSSSDRADVVSVMFM